MGINFGDLVSQNVMGSGFLAAVLVVPRTFMLVQLSNILVLTLCPQFQQCAARNTHFVP